MSDSRNNGENASPVRLLQPCDGSVENDHSCLHKLLLGQSKLMDRLDAMATQLSLVTTENAALRERLERVEEETKTNEVWATKRLDAAQKQTEHIRNNFSGELKDTKTCIDDVEQKLSTAIEKRAHRHLSFAEVASGSSPTSASVDATSTAASSTLPTTQVESIIIEERARQERSNNFVLHGLPKIQPTTGETDLQQLKKVFPTFAS